MGAKEIDDYLMGDLLMTRVILTSFLVTAIFFTGCTGVPKGLKPVTDFEPDQYLGKWYEIARLDHSFERNFRTPDVS